MLVNIRKRTRFEHWVLLSVIYFSITGWGCNTREQGCLNPDASNFDLNAEKACDDCCTFPSASITLSQKWNDENFFTADTFYDVHSNPYRILDLQYFLSSFAWENIDGQLFTVDSTNADCAGEPLRYTNDIVAIRPTLFKYPLGSFRTAEEVDSLRFHVGLVEDFTCLEDTLSSTPVILTPSSPLWNPNTESLSTIRLVLDRFRTDSLQDTVFIDVHHTFELAYPVVMKRGTDHSFLLTANYALWFATVDTADLNSFSTSVINGLPGSIFRTE